MIKYIIDQGVDTECKNNYGQKPTDLIKAEDLKNEIIEYIKIKKN